MRLPLRKHAAAPAATSVNGSSADIDDVDEVDDSNKNMILEIIKQLGQNTDLSRITLPTFILERKSMLERITNLMQHPNELIQAVHTKDPTARFLEVLKWYMSGWYIAPKAVKKPLNPVLGEYFTCYWPLENATAYYVAEQTSHHPPKSNYWYAIPEYGIHADGLLLPRSRFQVTSAASLMDGIGSLYFASHNETYTLTQPNMYARGVLTGHLKFELGDKAIVQCGDLRAEIEFKVKGWVSGGYNEIGGGVYRGSELLYTLSGHWNEVLYIKEHQKDHKGHSQVFFDCSNDKPVVPTVRPINEQGPYESGALWKPTIDALGQRNHELATDEKSKVENHQRAIARDRTTEFQPKLFAPVDNKLEWRFIASEKIREDPKHAHELVSQLVPILPGDKFPHNFEDSYQTKLTGAVPPPDTANLSEDDEFVDANDTYDKPPVA